MALGKHLFSFRTQKLSPVAAIILRKWETSTVPNYIKPPLTGGVLSFVRNYSAAEATKVEVGHFGISVYNKGITKLRHR